MRALLIDGTPVEIAEMVRSFGFSTTSVLTSEKSASGNAQTFSSVGKDGASAEGTEADFIERFLTRIPLAPRQKAVVQAIVDAEGNWILSNAIARQVGYSAKQFSGLMGAFGRRWANTRGYREEFMSVETEWDSSEKQMRYRARPTLLAVWKKLFAKTQTMDGR